MAKIETTSIFVTMKRLRVMLYAAQIHMQKCHRPLYGNPIMYESGQSLASFIKAYLGDAEDRMRNVDDCIAHFTCLRVDVEFAVTEHIIQFPHRRPDKRPDGTEGMFDDPRDGVNSQEIEILRLIGVIDSDLCKWRASLAKEHDRMRQEHAADFTR